MKRGFTLIEMLAVIAIMGLIIALVLPRLLDQVNSRREDISNSSKNLIYTAAELYMDNNSDNYPKASSNVYCISLKTLVDNGYLEKPLKDLDTDKDIPLDKVVKVTFNGYNESVFDITTKDKCS